MGLGPCLHARDARAGLLEMVTKIKLEGRRAMRAGRQLRPSLTTNNRAKGLSYFILRAAPGTRPLYKISPVLLV